MATFAALRNALLVHRDGETAVRLTDHDIDCLVASPDGERVLVGTYDAGLFRSTDGGRSFQGVEALPTHVMSLALDPGDPDVVWAGTEPSRVFRSADGGATWTEREGLTDLPSAGEWYFPPRPDTHHVRWLEPAPDDPDRLYVGIEAGAFVLSEDGGRTWRERPPGSRRDNHSLAVHPDAPDRVYAAAGDGYAVSEDRGETWDHPQTGLAHRYCWSVRPDPGDPDTVVVSSARGARSAHSLPAETYVYRREGEGPWTVAMDGLPGPDGLLRAVLATDGPGEFSALTNHGLYRSTDAARTWRRVDLDLEEWPAAYESQTPRGLAIR